MDPNWGMWWLIGSAPDFWGRCPGFESGISHNDPDALQDHCDQVENLRVENETYPWEEEKIIIIQDPYLNIMFFYPLVIFFVWHDACQLYIFEYF